MAMRFCLIMKLGLPSVLLGWARQPVIRSFFSNTERRFSVGLVLRGADRPHVLTAMLIRFLKRW